MGAHVSIPNYQRSLDERVGFFGYRCRACGTINFPRKGVCSHCRRSSEFDRVPLSGQGEVVTFTIISGGGAPPEFELQAAVQGQYAVAIIRLAEGPQVVAQLVDIDPQQVTIGMKVHRVLRRIYTQEGVVRYGYKFAP